MTIVAVLGVALLDGPVRVIALGVALSVMGLWWGALRLDAMQESALSHEVGSAGLAELVVTGPGRHSLWSLRVPAEVRAFRGRRLRERVLLLLPVERSPPQGAILEAEVIVAEPREDAAGFDERAWLARQGIHVVLRARGWRQVGRRGGVAGLGDRLRRRVEEAVERGASGRRRALVLGIVLGEDEDLPPRLRHDFRAAGLYHLLAVSGQNVAFIAGGVFGLGWLLRLPRIARELVTVAAIAGYVLAVGWQPSVARAGVAGVLASLAWLSARPRDRWHFLAVGALILLVWTPTSVFEPGFQLSFAAVAGIFAVVPRVRRRLDGYPVPARFGDVLAVALVCGLVTGPIVLADFGVAPVYTVPANALAEPAMPLVLGLGLFAAIADPVAPGAAAVLGWLSGWAASWIELVARVFASLPGAQVGPRGALVVLLVAASAWIVVRRRPSRA
jgi:competence protein ComEC